MPTPRTAAWRLVLLGALCAPLPLLAATYKCTVDGKVVYQQAPCGPGAEGEAMRIQSGPTGGGGSYSGSDAARMRQQLAREGPRLAFDAFERLKTGRIDEYVAHLCPRERQSFSNPTIKGSLKAEGARMAADKVEMARQPADTGIDALTFFAYHNPFGASDGRTPPKRIRVNAAFGRDLGQLCLRAMSFWSGS